ncbi:MAG: rod shape-determining protein MreC, partial [Caulobacteraceae bacterium]
GGVRQGRAGRARNAVDSVAGPAGLVLSAPIRWTEAASNAVGAYFLAGAQNRRLRAQLVAARAWRDRAVALAEENARYRALMGVKTDPPIPMVFARTVLDARGPFNNTRLADVGSARGVVEGNPVLSEHGLVGRIVGVARSASRILLLTDVESRTPILVPRTNARAILTGDGGPNPRLDYLRTHDPLREGDLVLTSGDGGVLPRGLPVGVVFKGFDGTWRVALDADASPIDYVQILLFKDFSQLVQPGALAPRDLPSAMTEEPSQSIIGATPAAASPVAETAPQAHPTAPVVDKPALHASQKPVTP